MNRTHSTGFFLLATLLLWGGRSEAQDQHFRRMCGNGEYLVGLTGQSVAQWVGTAHERRVLTRLQILCSRQAMGWTLASPVARGAPVGQLEGGSQRAVRCTTDQRALSRLFVDRPFVVHADIAQWYASRGVNVEEGVFDGGYHQGRPTLLSLALMDCRKHPASARVRRGAAHAHPG
jgi:hypothetical protein